MEGPWSLFWLGAMTTLCHGWLLCQMRVFARICVSYEAVRVRRVILENQLHCHFSRFFQHS